MHEKEYADMSKNNSVAGQIKITDAIEIIAINIDPQPFRRMMFRQNGIARKVRLFRSQMTKQDYYRIVHARNRARTALSTLLPMMGFSQGIDA